VGPAPSIARIILTPNLNTSLQLGNVINFLATAQNSANRTLAVSFTWASSDTSILNVAPNGRACAGHWDATFINCNPGGTGVVLVTATALGFTSEPTYVFVHSPIDSVSVTGVLLNNLPIQEPCLPQGQTMTVEAHAFSQGADITASVGPFTWLANNNSVAQITPLINVAYNFPTNQATVTAITPGLTEIFASASGASSTSFQQPQLPNAPVFDFFETCPIQNIVLELGHAGSLLTDFSVSKSTPETVIATVTDVMGNSSLPNTNGGVVLSKIPLTWASSQPAVVGTSNACQLSCTLSSPSPGAAAVTASCSPPTCNVGFPLAPPVLLSSACTQFVQSQFPKVNSCQQFIPLPVYSSPPQPPGALPPTTSAITGVVAGATSSQFTVLATSLGCAVDPPDTCTTSIYSFSSAAGASGNPNPMPASPNSLLFDAGGDRAYMGSYYGVQSVTPANFGTTSSPFAPQGTVIGKTLAVSNNGSSAAFSDTVHSPNQVYVVNAGIGNTQTVPLNISGASAAAFSPDGLKAIIFGFDSSTGNPTLYSFSTLQALQVLPALPKQTTVSSILFSNNGAFAYVVEPSLAGGNAAFTVYNTCDNQVSTDTPANGSTPQIIPLPGIPIAFKALPDATHFVALEADGNIDYITATVTGIPPATLTAPGTSLCPMHVSHSVKQISLGQGSIQPINFFVSPDGTLIYVVASDRNSILVYNFATGSAGTGIPLKGNATPVAADITVDGALLMVAASDGMVHRVGTGLAGSDQAQIPFVYLPNQFNAFCTFGSCQLDLIAVRP